MRYVISTIILIISLTALSFAQWPTEPHQGITAFTRPNHLNRIVALSQDSLGGVTYLVNSVIGDIAVPGQLMIQGLDLDGNYRWPENPYGHYVTTQYSFSTNWNMACGSDSITWVGWDENQDVPEPILFQTNELRLQRVGADGQGQWGPLGIVLSELHLPITGGSEFEYLHPLSDGSIIVVYNEGGYGEIGLEDKLWAVRLDEDANEIWRLDLIPDSSWSVSSSFSKNAVSNGDEGFFFMLRNYPMYLQVDGTFAWPLGQIQFDSTSSCWLCKTLQNDIAAIGLNRNDVFNSTWLSFFDESGGLPVGQGQSIPTATYYSGPFQDFFKIGNSYYAYLWHPSYLLLFDQQFEPIFEEFSRQIFDFPPHCISTNKVGIRSNHVNYTYDLQAVDSLGNYAWEVEVYEPSSMTTLTVKHIIDILGNTWVIWPQYPFPNNNEFELYANVIDLEGNWGSYESDIESEYFYSLPTTIKLNVFPNPFNANVNIQIDGRFEPLKNLKIFNLLGREVYSKDLSGLSPDNLNITWQTGFLGSGSYFISVSTEQGQIYNKKVLKIQ